MHGVRLCRVNECCVLKHILTLTVSLSPGGAQLEYACLAFSSDGQRLASLSGVPDFTLIIWYVHV